jgi:hypothetical protein
MNKRQSRRINKTIDAAMAIHKANRKRLAETMLNGIDLKTAPDEIVKLSNRLAELWDWLGYNDPYMSDETRKFIADRLEKIQADLATATATALRK